MSAPLRILLYGHKIQNAEENDNILLVISELQRYQTDIFLHKNLAKELAKYNRFELPFKTLDSTKDIKDESIDHVITLGGDGTILHAITLIKDAPISILGINLGRLGFLASVEKKIIPQAIHQLINNDYLVVKRSLLHIACNHPLFDNFPYALNDFTLNKRDTSSMITIHTSIDGQVVNSYWADGIIISTPTGSTGYSLSCGGPIVFPDSQNFVITPVAPHNLNVRPIVIPDFHKISLQVEGRTDSFMCTLDSRYETITSKHTIDIQKGDFPVRFIQLTGLTFMKTISEKLLWGIDKRN